MEAVVLLLMLIFVVDLLVNVFINRLITGRLLFAIEINDLQRAQILLSKGANPNAHHGELLIEAVCRRNFGAAKLLIDYGADVNLENGRILSKAIVHCYLTERYDVLEFLLKHGADVHARGDSAIAEAVKFGDAEMVQLLLKFGANPHAAGNLAEYYTLNRPEIAELLSKY